DGLGEEREVEVGLLRRLRRRVAEDRGDALRRRREERSRRAAVALAEAALERARVGAERRAERRRLERRADAEARRPRRTDADAVEVRIAAVGLCRRDERLHAGAA